MSGTIRGLIDSYHGNTDEYENGSEVWKIWFDFFSAHPNMTRIAYNLGLGGTGTDHWNEPNPWGSNPWGVFRMETSAARTYPIYMLFQSSTGTGSSRQLGLAPGDPCTTRLGVALQYMHLVFAFAIGEGGDENPWNGTSNNDGSDDKGGSAAFALGNDGNGTVWRVPVGGTKTLLLPRSNAPGGSHVAIQEECINASYTSVGSPFRCSLICDDDNIYTRIDVDPQGSGHSMCFGILDPHPSLAGSYDYPFAAFRWDDNLNVTVARDEGDGGIMFHDSSIPEPVHAARLLQPVWMTTVGQPNSAISPAQFDLAGLYIAEQEGVQYGMAGTFSADNDFFKWCYNVPHNSTNVGKTRAVFGSGSTATLKACVPWDGVTTPGTHFTRAGISF